MFDSAKYLIVDTGTNEAVVIFSGFLSHDVVAGRLGSPVVSAGFVDFDQDGPHCFGKSTSLDIKSRGEADNALVRLSLRMKRNHSD